MPDAPVSPDRDGDAVRPVVVGTVLAALTLVVLLTQRTWLDERDAQWWIGAAAAATVLGLIGVMLVLRQRRRSPAAEGQRNQT